MIVYIGDWSTMKFFEAYGLFRKVVSDGKEEERHSLYDKSEIRQIDATGKVDIEAGTYYPNKRRY